MTTKESQAISEQKHPDAWSTNLKQPAPKIHGEVLIVVQWHGEQRDMQTSSRLIPLVHDLTHILGVSNGLYPRTRHYMWEL